MTTKETNFAIFTDALRKNCPYSELFWSAFSRIRTEYGKIFRISPYSVPIRENADQNNSEYGNFWRSDDNTPYVAFENFNDVIKNLEEDSIKLF